MVPSPNLNVLCHCASLVSLPPRMFGMTWLCDLMEQVGQPHAKVDLQIAIQCFGKRPCSVAVQLVDALAQFGFVLRFRVLSQRSRGGWVRSVECSETLRVTLDLVAVSLKSRSVVQPPGSRFALLTLTLSAHTVLTGNRLAQSNRPARRM